MKEITFTIIAIILMLELVGISVAENLGVSKEVIYSTEDTNLLNEKGYNDLPYSTITCNENSNCTYSITRAGKEFIRDLGTKDMRTAENNQDADIKKYLDESLAMFKADAKADNTAGTIKVWDGKEPKESLE